MNKENSDTYSVTCQCPRLLVFVLAAALVFGAVCVGGVSGATIYVGSEKPGNLGTDEHWYSNLEGAISAANNLNGADTLVLTEDMTVSETYDIVSDITITNDENTNVVLTSDNSYSMFHVYATGKLTLSGTDSPSHSLTLRGQDWVIQWGNGGAVYVDGGSFVMDEGVTIRDFGLLGSQWAGKAAVYVNSGAFVMNGGTISNCLSSRGSGVYVAQKGSFEMNDGLITENGHNGLWFTSATYGGGVYVEDDGVLTSSGDKTLDDMIYGNKGNPQYVYNNPDKTRTYSVYHFFYDINGNNPTENQDLRQTAVGNYGEQTNAQPHSIPGYVNRDIAQQTIKEDGSTVVTVYYDISISYKITIPDNLVIAEDSKTGTLTLTPTELWILETGEVSVSVSSKYEFALAYAGDPSVRVSYELSNEEGVLENGDPVAGFTLQNPNSVSLTAQVTGHAPYVGAYNDLLTFTAEYIDPIFTQN